MPNTKLQKVLFALLMSLIMVFGMETYNRIIAAGSFNRNVFYISALELAGLMTIVIALETLIAGKLARKLAFSFVSLEKSHPFLIILAIQISTVLVMCPIMSFVATLIFKNGLHHNTLLIWLQAMAVNFPMALLWQILIAGPIVRFTVSKITK
ncbi:MAG: DUF2798 domain-containing protein [Prevotellaceae bacterium]|jgi:hypothetical protein|nr:DUF2798 domain-containing protein [Prevotellaceae bacterium]